jgi:PUA domain protein
MFKKFTPEEVTGQNQVKASVQRKIRQSIADEYPDLEPLLEDMLPKKAPLIVAKCQNHINLVVVNNVPLFFNVRDGPYMPTLRLLHQYPGVMKMFRVDRGAIKFVLAGANIMCPGLTSAGGALDEEVSADAPVVCALSLQLFHSCLSQWEESCFISLCKIGCSVLVY